MSWLFSRALVEEYSAGTCSDGEPSAHVNWTETPQPFSHNGRTMDFSGLSRFGVTSRPLTEAAGEALLTSFLVAFPARTSAPPAKALGSQGPEADSGRTWHGSLATFDPATSSWRTPQCSLLGDSESFSETWPRWGSMRSGACSQRLALAPTICASGSGYWPTPVAHDDGKSPEAHMAMKARMKGGPRRKCTSLTVMVKGIESGMWQTPVADDAVDRAAGKFNSRGEPKLSAQVMFATPTTMDALPPKSADSLLHEATGHRAGRARPGNLRDQVMNAENWPTPCASNTTGPGHSGRQGGLNLQTAVATFPTPTVSMHKGSSGGAMTRISGKSRENDRLDYAIEGSSGGTNGRLNPTWVEWLMGWPEGWTAFESLGTDRFREWSSAHTPSFTDESRDDA